MKWTIRALTSFFFSLPFSPPLHMLTRGDVSFSTMSLFLCLLDILKSLILLIFKKKEGFLPQAAEEEFVFSGFLFPDEES